MVEGNLMSMVARERLGLGHRPREIYIKERWRSAQNLNSMDLISHYGCVNAVEFDGKGDWLVSGGDDRRVLVWNVNKALAGRVINSRWPQNTGLTYSAWGSTSLRRACTAEATTSR